VRLLGELAGQRGARAGPHQNRQSGVCVPRNLSALQPLLDRVVWWAESVREVRAIALVGSWARGEARADSDVDLIVLALYPETLVSDTSWTAFVGPPTLVTVEEWGAIVTGFLVGINEGENDLTARLADLHDEVTNARLDFITGRCEVPEGKVTGRPVL